MGCAGVATGGAETDGVEAAGTASGACASSRCFRPKTKTRTKIDAIRIAAAANAITSVVDFDRVGCFRVADGVATLGAGVGSSAAKSAGTCFGGIGRAGGVGGFTGVVGTTAASGGGGIG